MNEVATHLRFVLNGRWLFNEETDELGDLRGEVETRILMPVASRLLGLLVRAPRMIIGRRQLFDQGWRQYGFEVCDNSLNQVMCRLREVFTEIDPGHPYIKTLPRIGYSLLANVQTGHPAFGRIPLSAPSAHQAEPESPPAVSYGLPDRAAFDRAASSEWRRAQRSGLPLSLLMLSVQGATAFRARRQVTMDFVAFRIGARRLRAGDVAAVYTDGLFGIVLPDTGMTGAAKLAADLHRTVLSPVDGPQSLSLHPSELETGIASTESRRYETQEAWTEAALSALRPGVLAGET